MKVALMEREGREEDSWVVGYLQGFVLAQGC